jgi:hypothetical protein
MIKEWGFAPVTYERERSFNLYGKIEDHANDVHDFLKYLKFGYGRATDDASMEIRHGRMTREEGIDMVRATTRASPRTLDCYCDFLGISKQRSTIWWSRCATRHLGKPNGRWIAKLDSVDRHADRRTGGARSAEQSNRSRARAAEPAPLLQPGESAAADRCSRARRAAGCASRCSEEPRHGHQAGRPLALVDSAPTTRSRGNASLAENVRR